MPTPFTLSRLKPWSRSAKEATESPSMSTSANKPAVLLAEPRISGHRLAYVKVLAEEALGRGHSVHVGLPPGAGESTEFQTHIASLLHRISIITIAHFNLQSLEAISSTLGVARTVVTDGDALALQLAKRGRWRGGGRLSILIMRENVQQKNSLPIYWAKNGAKKAVIRGVALVPRVDLAVLKSATWSGSSKLRIAVDPVHISCSQSDIDAIRTNWGMDRSTYWFAVLGAITSRKNVPLLARSISQITDTDVGLVIAGRIDPAIRQEIEAVTTELRASGRRIILVDRTLSDTELDAAVTAADCLLLAHSNEGPSGLLGKAACTGTRVLAAGARSLQVDTQTLEGLAEWTELEEDTIAAAMVRAVDSGLGEATIPSGSESFLKALLPVV